MNCKHMNFRALVKVARLENVGQFMAEITICCDECKKPFQFLGLQPGIDLQGARVSLDGLEANIAICPEGSRPNPLQNIVFNVRKFES